MNSSRARRSLFAACVIGLTLLVPAGASASYGSPLAGWWPMNERSGQRIYDWSGNGNHGTLGASTAAESSDPTWIRGIFNVGSALRFDGDDLVSIPDSRSLRPAKLTVSAWFRGDETGDNRYIVAKGGDRCEAGSFALYSSLSAGLGFYVYDGTDWIRSPEVHYSVWDGRWHHAAGTYDGRTVRLFLDGDQVGTGTPADVTINYDLPSVEGTIGAYAGTCDLSLVGDVDGVSIWNRALPISNLAQLIKFIGSR